MLKNLQSQAELLYCVAILFEVVQVLLLCTIKCKLILIYLCIFCAYRWEIIFLAIGRDFFSHPAVLLLVSSGQPRPMRRNSTQLLTWNIPENFTPSFCLFFFTVSCLILITNMRSGGQVEVVVFTISLICSGALVLMQYSNILKPLKNRLELSNINS